MRGPAIAQTTCPGCGAPIKIDVWSQVHTCRFCGQSAFVHRPNQPVLPPPPGQENFRHIHVTSAAVNKSAFLIVIFVFVGVNVLGGIITAFVVGLSAIGAAVASRPTGPTVRVPSPTVTVVTPTQPAPGPVNGQPQALGPNCQKAIRCCKAISPQNTGCDMMGMLGEVDCARQARTFEDSARSMNKTCN
jgi:hypothetical protein